MSLFIMDYVLIAAGAILMLAGIVGCALPVIPGPPLSYLGLWLLHASSRHSFSASFLILWAVITALVVVLDIIVPAWGTRRFGGCRTGVWGSVIGLFVGLILFPPFGIIAGAFVGAVLGELIAGKNAGAAMRSGCGSFVGYWVGTMLKLTASGFMAWHFASELLFATHFNS